MELVTFGEAMIRFAPLTEKDEDTASTVASASANFLRSVGGDEMNVAVALSRIGVKSQWISVLPTGPMGDIIKDCGVAAGVDMSKIIYKDKSEIGFLIYYETSLTSQGTFYVFPKQRAVHYQRAHSAWAQQEKDLFDWKSIFNRKNIWLHITGISPLTGPNPEYNWKKAIDAALHHSVPISMDLNHRKLLGTLSHLWSITTPYLSQFKLLILSLDSLRGIAAIEGFKTPSEDASEEDPIWVELLTQIQKKYSNPRIACCFKSRDSSGLQRRWSVVVDSQGPVTTYDYPVFHRPKDELGGGSAWAAGYIDAMMEKGLEFSQLRDSARRADLLAALCQETPGDHSVVTRELLSNTEKQFLNKAAHIGEEFQFLRNAELNSLKQIQERIKKAKVVAIIRGKDAELAIERGLELVEMGCKALEITLDTDRALYVLEELVKRIPKEKCIIGVGTVMDTTPLDSLAKIGIQFAISPINPTGFVSGCHERGILAIPAACTPNELWQTHLQGALVVKLFPTQLWTPSALKDLIAVGKFSELNIMATGGITPDKVAGWLEAGAAVTAMGSKLAGRDVRLKRGDKDFEEAYKEWQEKGKADARKAFELIYK